MKENKGKEPMGEGSRPEIHSRTRPFAGDKRKTVSKTLDLGNLPSRRVKKSKHGLSQTVTKSALPSSHTPVQVLDVDSPTPELTPSKTPPSKSAATTSSQPPRVPSNLVENEDLAWERFEKVVLDEDIAACYDMSLKDFEHSGVHDLFKVHTSSFLV